MFLRPQLQLSSATIVKQWKHLGTFRGHRTAVYCAVMTQDGKYVITGSDDCLVKVRGRSYRSMYRC